MTQAMKDKSEVLEPEMLEPEDFNQLNDADGGNGANCRPFIALGTQYCPATDAVPTSLLSFASILSPRPPCTNTLELPVAISTLDVLLACDSYSSESSLRVVLGFFPAADLLELSAEEEEEPKVPATPPDLLSRYACMLKERSRNSLRKEKSVGRRDVWVVGPLFMPGSTDPALKRG